MELKEQLKQLIVERLMSNGITEDIARTVASLNMQQLSTDMVLTIQSYGKAQYNRALEDALTLGDNFLPHSIYKNILNLKKH